MDRKRKVLIILHLCFAFSYLFWLGMQPFLRQVTATKAASLLIGSVVKNERFDQLPENQQLELLKGQEEIRKGSFRPLVTKRHFVGAGIIWAILSILVCFFLLFYIEGASLAAWLLPLAVLVYAFSLNRDPPLLGEQLFPPESNLTERYITAGESFKNKQEEIAAAWNRYLIHEWANEEPSTNLVTHADQLDRAVFNFNVERASWVLAKRGEDATVAHLLFHPPFVLLIAFFIWNLVFAWRISRFEVRLRKSVKAAV